MEQKIEALTDLEVTDLAARRQWVIGHFSDESRWKYDLVDGKLYLLEGILKGNFYPKSDVHKWQSLGIAFGDALTQELGLTWVAVDDAEGRTPALQDERCPSTIIYPMSMISKRKAQDEEFYVREFFDELCEKVREFRGEAKDH